jgi:hypothetical protein
MDGKEMSYENVGFYVFSPDGKRLAYAAQKAKQWVVVVDGKEGKEYDSIGHLTFSPDSKTVVYSARRGDRQLTIAGGKEGKLYYGIAPIVFDSPNTFHYLATDAAGMNYLVEQSLR